MNIRLNGQSKRQSPYGKNTKNRVTGEIQKQLQSKKQTGNVKIDTRLAFSNLLQAEWIILFYDAIKHHKQMP